VAVGPSVGLIGGGNSAIDAARAARRLPGVDKVTVFYRRTRNEMPAFEEEVEAALEEGIEINFLTAPKRILADDGKVTGVEFISMDLGEPDDSGRRRPVPREGSEYVVELDSLITAIGERPDPALVESDLGCELERWGGLKSDPETFVTNIEGVFAGGDVVTGPNTVIDAIAAGKWAGAMIDRFVSGEPVARSYALKRPSVYADAIEPVEDEPGSNRRAAEPHLDAGDRAGDFREVVSCLGEGDAMAEAKRCLRCDLQTADARRWMDEVEKSKPA
jgi:NADH-quinone oxidoreductase subunit F